ncbi:HEPN domain-containing protein [Mycolicibacterium sp. CR10]|uniref:HEPN domain-containing protein n=1 Tax=Mycolicibacterium sp. CR10 TaxID=2562314 RepID=UPI0010BF71F1|nr:HEPN domain-containing protein [Mycolicibacterium sp. CR10]
MTGSPIHELLWEVTLPAVRAAWAAAKAYVDSGKYVPRFEPPTFEVNDAGWPATVEFDRIQVPVTAPVDWSKLFALEPSTYTYVTVPELGNALAAVRQAAEHDEAFADGINPFNHVEDPKFRERSLGVDYLTLVGSIIGRAAALGLDSDQDLFEIYAQLERARFAPHLTGDLVIPLTLTDFGTGEPFLLGDDVFVERIAPEFQCSRAASIGSSGANPYLVAAATHAVVVRGITVPNRPYSTRLLGTWGGLNPIDSKYFEEVDRAIQSIHIVMGRRVGYNQVLVRPDNWADRWVHDLPPVWKVETVSRYPENSSFAPWHTSPRPIDPDHGREIGAAFLALTSAPDDVKLAARRAVRALMRTNDEDRTLDATIGIEALLLDENAELKYRMALRAAAALFDDHDPEGVFNLAKKIYDHRSDIAHGKVKANPSFNYRGHTVSSPDMAPLLLRALLRSRLLSKHPWTKKDLEPRILAALANYRPGA